MQSLAQVLRDATRALAGDSARADAELLLAHALGRPRSWLYSHSDDRIDPAACSRFEAMLASRQRGEPVAQILGQREFWSLLLTVNADTLIPRPETELLVELALRQLPPSSPRRVLDLGTGTGAIALALAHERPLAQVTAVDVGPRTLAVARKNAARLALGNVEFLLGDWFSAVAGERYDLIVSNPPYIADSDPHLLEGDLRFEPRQALVSGVDGLDALRVIAAAAPLHLRTGGSLLVEHGHEQGAAVRGLLSAAGLVGVTTSVDLEGRDRVSSGTLAAEGSQTPVSAVE
jgi:release factor glutamine methyltransferase